MQTSPVPRRQRTLIASLIIVGLVSAGWLVWWQYGRTPGAKEVIAFLDRSVGGERVRFSAVKMEWLPRDETGLKIAVAAKAGNVRALYAKMDVADYLRQTFQLDPTSAGEARSLLSLPGSAKQPDFQAAAPFPADPFQAVILRTTTPAGAAFAFNGIIKARRDGGSWTFDLITGGFEGAGPLGEPRSGFGATSYAVGEVGDEARLRELVAGFEAYAKRLAGIRQDIASARGAAIADRRSAFLADIAPGRVFRGTALDTGSQRETPLYLEITGLTSGNEVTAVLRNDNSWHVARTFQGTWSADEQFEAPVLNLASRPKQAVRNAGPFLDNTQVWRFTLQRNAKGELTEQNRFFQYRFQAVTPEQVTALRSRIEEEFEQAFAATEPGTLYLGTGVSRISGASESIFLRFGPRAPDSEALAATLESTTRPWQRPLHGVILANAHLSGGLPIRLQTDPKEAVVEASTGSALGHPGALNLNLGFGPGQLVGGDEKFTYQFSPASAADLARMETGRAERERRFAGVLRSGIVFDGVMRAEGGYVFKTRLEFTRVDRPAGAITARIRSLNRLKVHREFLGSWDPAGDMIVLTAADKGFLDRTIGFNIPFFISRTGVTLHLALTGNSLTGRIVGEPDWTLEFPADALFPVAADGGENGSPFSDDGAGLPALPKADGAYLLSEGSWVSLPANHGHIVAEPVPDLTEDEEAANDLRELKGVGGAERPEKNSKRKAKDKEMISYLDFDGKEPRPVAHGPAIVLLWVGPTPTDNPALELARTRIMEDGRRRIKILGSTPAPITLGDQRSAAYVRQIAPNAMVLTTTSKPAPGTYLINAGVGYELTVE